MTEPKQILLRILEIIGYAEDKDKFATEFLQNVSLQSLLDLFDNLPQDKKSQISQNITSAGNDPQKLGEVLKSYFTQQHIQDAIQNSAKNAITEYINAIQPTLSDIQKQNLAAYFKELGKTSMSSV